MVGADLRDKPFIDTYKKQRADMVKSRSLYISHHDHVKRRRNDTYFYFIKARVKYIRKLPDSHFFFAQQLFCLFKKGNNLLIALTIFLRSRGLILLLHQLL